MASNLVLPGQVAVSSWQDSSVFSHQFRASQPEFHVSMGRSVVPVVDATCVNVAPVGGDGYKDALLGMKSYCLCCAHTPFSFPNLGKEKYVELGFFIADPVGMLAEAMDAKFAADAFVSHPTMVEGLTSPMVAEHITVKRYVAYSHDSLAMTASQIDMTVMSHVEGSVGQHVNMIGHAISSPLQPFYTSCLSSDGVIQEDMLRLRIWSRWMWVYTSEILLLRLLSLWLLWWFLKRPAHLILFLLIMVLC